MTLQPNEVKVTVETGTTASIQEVKRQLLIALIDAYRADESRLVEIVTHWETVCNETPYSKDSVVFLANQNEWLNAKARLGDYRTFTSTLVNELCRLGSR